MSLNGIIHEINLCDTPPRLNEISDNMSLERFTSAPPPLNPVAAESSGGFHGIKCLMDWQKEAFVWRTEYRTLKFAENSLFVFLLESGFNFVEYVEWEQITFTERFEIYGILF